jgi:hypothetical protein
MALVSQRFRIFLKLFLHESPLNKKWDMHILEKNMHHYQPPLVGAETRLLSFFFTMSCHGHHPVNVKLLVIGFLFF